MALTEEERTKAKAFRNANRKRYQSWKLSTDQKEELVRRFCAGETVSELARAFSIQPDTVTYHIDRAIGGR